MLYSHVKQSAHGTARGCFSLLFFSLHNRLVWIIEVRIIEGPDNRGPDNRGSTVHVYGS